MTQQPHASSQVHTPHILILDTSDNIKLFEGHLISQLLQNSPLVSENKLSFSTRLISTDASLVPHSAEELPSSIVGIIISGTTDSCMDDSLPYVAPLMQFIRSVHSLDRHLLWGICGGAQMILRALGGDATVGIMAKPEYGHKEITLHEPDDPLHRDLPSTFLATLCHGDYFDTTKFEKAKLLCSSKEWTHQAYRIGDHTWGTQFHPEILTEEAERIYADARKRGIRVTHDTNSSIEVIDKRLRVVASTMAKNFASLCLKFSRSRF